MSPNVSGAKGVRRIWTIVFCNVLGEVALSNISYFNSRAFLRHSLTLRIPFSESIPMTFIIIDLFIVSKDSHFTTEGTFIPVSTISSPSIKYWVGS